MQAKYNHKNIKHLIIKQAIKHFLCVFGYCGNVHTWSIWENIMTCSHFVQEVLICQSEEIWWIHITKMKMYQCKWNINSEVEKSYQWTIVTTPPSLWDPHQSSLVHPSLPGYNEASAQYTASHIAVAHNVNIDGDLSPVSHCCSLGRCSSPATKHKTATFTKATIVV